MTKKADFNSVSNRATTPNLQIGLLGYYAPTELRNSKRKKRYRGIVTGEFGEFVWV